MRFDPLPAGTSAKHTAAQILRAVARSDLYDERLQNAQPWVFYAAVSDGGQNDHRAMWVVRFDGVSGAGTMSTARSIVSESFLIDDDTLAPAGVIEE